MTAIEIRPIRPSSHFKLVESAQVARIKEATLAILDEVGVHIPSAQALAVFAEHGAAVDTERQTVRLPPDLVLRAMGSAPRSFTLGGRAQGTQLVLDGEQTYFSTDGCGVHTLDSETGQLRASTKADVALMARVSDFLSSIAFYWPMVSAQDHGHLAPLHEIDASFNNTVKHIQTETVMGAGLARYAVRMAEVIAGDPERLRAEPPLSSLICTIAPLGQDKDGLEAGMVFARAGIPVGFMSMPNMGSTAPASIAGALAQASAEIISALVLMQLVAPGAPVFYSVIASVMHPSSADYINTLSEKYLCHGAGVEIAHDWGVPILGGAFGVDSAEPASWQLGRDSVYTALLTPLAGADFVVGMGLLGASTVLVPEQILLDDEIYHTHRLLLEGLTVDEDRLALDVIGAVGPRGNYLSQKHTRHHLREIWIPELTHPGPGAGADDGSGLVHRAQRKLQQILHQHEPEPLSSAQRKELSRIMETAEAELGT
jgi:trimethylamine--corrinoid protein Co-methyltransferase